MPTLVLVRHAEAEPPGPEDRSRRLLPSGHADAVALGDWFRVSGLAPDQVLVSTAVRARETWQAAAVGGRVEARDDLYDAGAEQLRDVVRETGPDVGTLVVVGHNPGLSRLAWELDDSPAARSRTERGLPPGGAVVVELDTWDAAFGTLVAARP